MADYEKPAAVRNRASPYEEQATRIMGKAYNEHATEFEAHARNSFTWENVELEALKTLAPYLSDHVQVLDAGCGSGRVAEFLISRGVAPENIVGVDISEENIRIAKEKVNKKLAEKNIPGVHFLVGDMRNIPPRSFIDEPASDLYPPSPTRKYLAPESKDLVIVHMVPEFLDEQGFDAFLENCYEVLKEGGTLACVTTHPKAVTSALKVSAKGWFSRTAPWGKRIFNYWRSTDDFVAAINNAGFAHVACEELLMPSGAGAEDKDPEKYRKYAENGPLRLLMVAEKPVPPPFEQLFKELLHAYGDDTARFLRETGLTDCLGYLADDGTLTGESINSGAITDVATGECFISYELADYLGYFYVRLHPSNPNAEKWWQGSFRNAALESRVNPRITITDDKARTTILEQLAEGQDAMRRLPDMLAFLCIIHGKKRRFMTMQTGVRQVFSPDFYVPENVSVKEQDAGAIYEMVKEYCYAVGFVEHEFALVHRALADMVSAAPSREEGFARVVQVLLGGDPHDTEQLINFIRDGAISGCDKIEVPGPDGSGYHEIEVPNPWPEVLKDIRPWSQEEILFMYNGRVSGLPAAPEGTRNACYIAWGAWKEYQSGKRRPTRMQQQFLQEVFGIPWQEGMSESLRDMAQPSPELSAMQAGELHPGGQREGP